MVPGTRDLGLHHGQTDNTLRHAMSNDADKVVKLRRERDTSPPPPDEPTICKGLEVHAEALGMIRENVEWMTDSLVLIANHLGVKLPPRPVQKPR